MWFAYAFSSSLRVKHLPCKRPPDSVRRPTTTSYLKSYDQDEALKHHISLSPDRNIASRQAMLDTGAPPDSTEHEHLGSMFFSLAVARCTSCNHIQS